jgi:hypothetical protein
MLVHLDLRRHPTSFYVSIFLKYPSGFSAVVFAKP